jgi:hypothetical protein
MSGPPEATPEVAEASSQPRTTSTLTRSDSVRQWRVLGSVAKALSRFKAALNPTYDYGKKRPATDEPAVCGERWTGLIVHYSVRARPGPCARSACAPAPPSGTCAQDPWAGQNAVRA